MEQLLKEIKDVINACEQENKALLALVFLHGMKTAIMLGLNKDGEENEGNTKV